jgi:hypothetical protein
MGSFKENFNIRNSIFIFLAIIVPALPIAFLSTFSDFAKSPICLFVVIYDSLFNHGSINDPQEIFYYFAIYLILFIVGIEFYKKRSVLILTIFSIINVLFSLHIIRNIG